MEEGEFGRLVEASKLLATHNQQVRVTTTTWFHNSWLQSGNVGMWVRLSHCRWHHAVTGSLIGQQSCFTILSKDTDMKWTLTKLEGFVLLLDIMRFSPCWQFVSTLWSNTFSLFSKEIDLFIIRTPHWPCCFHSNSLQSIKDNSITGAVETWFRDTERTCYQMFTVLINHVLESTGE